METDSTPRTSRKGRIALPSITHDMKPTSLSKKIKKKQNSAHRSANQDSYNIHYNLGKAPIEAKNVRDPGDRYRKLNVLSLHGSKVGKETQ